MKHYTKIFALFTVLMFASCAKSQVITPPPPQPTPISINQLPTCVPSGPGQYIYVTIVPTDGSLPKFACALLNPTGVSVLTSTSPFQVTVAQPANTSISYTYGESPTGVVDGVNRSFTTLEAPTPAASLIVYRNIGKQTVCTQDTPVCDYTLAGNTITFAVPPVVGDILMVIYRRP